jgi:hypothetical protein
MVLKPNRTFAKSHQRKKLAWINTVLLSMRRGWTWRRGWAWAGSQRGSEPGGSSEERLNLNRLPEEMLT